VSGADSERSRHLAREAEGLGQAQGHSGNRVRQMHSARVVKVILSGPIEPFGYTPRGGRSEQLLYRVGWA
jgi:hypothetical protein